MVKRKEQWLVLKCGSYSSGESIAGELLSMKMAVSGKVNCTENGGFLVDRSLNSDLYKYANTYLNIWPSFSYFSSIDEQTEIELLE